MRRLTLGWIVAGLAAASVLGLSFLLSSVVVAAQGQDPADLVRQGDRLLRQSDFVAAEAAYNAALAADPDYAAAYAHRCYLRTVQFLPGDAVADCQRAIALAPEDPEGYIYLIRAYDWSEKFDEAIEVGRRAILLAPESGLAHSFLGEAYIDLGRFEEGEAELRLAAELAPNEPEVHRNLAYLYLLLGQTEDLFDELAIAQSLAPDFVNYPLEAAHLHYGVGQYELAVECFQQALAIQREIGDRAGEWISLTSIGVVYQSLGQYQQALEAHHQALAIQQEISDRVGEGISLNNIGLIYQSLGQYEAALEAYQQSLAIRQELRDPAGEATMLNNIGGVYDHLGQYDKALDYYQEALTMAQEMDDLEGEEIGLNNVGTVFLSEGRYEQALGFYQDALIIAQAIADREGEAAVLNNMGEAYHAMGQYEQALNSLQQALLIQREINDRIGEAGTLDNIAGVYSEHEQYGQASQYLQESLTIARKIDDAASQVTRLHNLGLLSYHQGDTAQAIVHYQQAIEVIESVQGGIRVDELKSSFAGEQVDTYTNLIALLWLEERMEDAFDYAERARAQAFLEQVGNEQVDFRRGAAPELIQEEEALRQQIFGLQNAIASAQGEPLGQQQLEHLESLSQELEAARRAHEQLITKLKLANPEYASLVSVKTLSLENVQTELLDDHTTLVEYFILDDGVLAWVIDQEWSALAGLDIGPDELQNKIEFLRDLIPLRDSDRGTSAELYDELFAPLEPYIHHANLVIVPHGALHYLPFAALWDAEHERYLMEDYAITYAPSASVLQFILDKRNDDEGRLLALGNPDGSLPLSEAETEAIAGLYGTAPLLGREATESQVYAQAGQVDLLHLSAHGVYNPHNALYSRIELAADAAQDGNLEVHEIFGLDLMGVNLVVLSACETALGEQSEGDELVGLTRAFLYAGAPAVVTTLWSVDDVASGALMEAFYGHLRTGLTNAEALQAAQMEVKAQEGWEEPYYWAAFSLTGDYRGSVEPGMGLAETTDPMVTPATVQTPTRVETPTSAPPVAPSPTAGGGRDGLCAGAALPLGLVLLGGIQRRRMRRRDGS